MDARLFRAEPMGLDEVLLERPLSQRLSLDEQAGVLYIDLDGYRVRTLRDVEAVREGVASRVAPLGRKVAAIISYDACTIAPEVSDAWFAMAARCREPLLQPRVALHHERVHAPQARRGPGAPRRGPAHLRDAA